MKIIAIKHYRSQIFHTLFMGVLVSMSCTLHAATKADAVKAGVIYNLTKFTVWPSTLSTTEQFRLCVVGNNKDDGLDAINGKLVMDKPIVITRNPKDSMMIKCQILFIPKASQMDIEKVLNKCKESPILTVSDSPNFIDQGGMVGLIQDKQRIGFEVNLTALNSNGINIESQLLKLAKRVKGLN